MVILCSNGLTSNILLNAVRKCLPDKGKAALVVTADNEFKEKNYHVQRCADEMNSLGFSVECFDIDVQPASELIEYDVVEFIGGNPYYLLNSIRKNHAEKILRQVAKEKVLIGWSAGALVMGPTIKLINQYSPEMNFLHIADFSGLNLTNIQILPHYNKFLNRYKHFEEKCLEYEKNEKCSVMRLNDGDGIIIDGGMSIIRAI